MTAASNPLWDAFVTQQYRERTRYSAAADDSVFGKVFRHLEDDRFKDLVESIIKRDDYVLKEFSECSCAKVETRSYYNPWRKLDYYLDHFADISHLAIEFKVTWQALNWMQDLLRYKNAGREGAYNWREMFLASNIAHMQMTATPNMAWNDVKTRTSRLIGNLRRRKEKKWWVQDLPHIVEEPNDRNPDKPKLVLKAKECNRDLMWAVKRQLIAQLYSGVMLVPVPAEPLADPNWSAPFEGDLRWYL